MKVLFAVSNEEISETIVKKYQSMYKQIISYKNVYYFNAILKELQKDKSYDRIVISEDLEAFTHTQYDQIDKFIFEKLDSISDEASNNRGNDTPIILICSERRTKSEQILVKLFGIGIYNAIIGNDRSTEEVCKLINRPRTKKEAKTYYKIDVEDVNYQAESENDVSEMEIQNILAHYKRLGKNEDRYIESFNNIAAQYNDTQLRIITKFLPLNVRAVLEESSPKYQQIMSFNNSVSNDLRTKNKQKENEGTSEILLKSENRETIMSKPVVIPRAVNMKGIKKLAKPQQNVEHVAKEVTYTGEQHLQQRNEHKNIEPEQTQNVREIKEEVVEQEEPKPVKRGRGRPRKNAVPEVQNTAEQPVKRKRGRPRKNPIEEPKTVESIEVQQEEPIVPGFEDIDDETKVKQEENYNDTILPGFEETDEKEDTFLPGFDDTEPEPIKEPEKSTILPGFEDEQEQNYENYRYEAPQQNETEYKTLENENTQQNETNENNEYSQNNISYNSRTQEYNYTNNEQEEEEYESTIDLTNLLTPDKKIVSFIGTSKNGTSFIVNNLAEQMAKIGINTAILDTTKNRNSYYIYTKNEEQLRQTASKSIDGLAVGITNGINVEKNLTVYTSLPNENGSIKNVDKILETLIKNYSLVLIDTDFNTPKGYFKQSQETYLVQTMDILTIQPLTAFLKELKARNILDEKKLRIILNKVVKIRGIKDETIIGGMAFYNDPSMSFMTELFDRTRIKYISIPFEEETYIRYLEGIIKCEISLKGYSKAFLQSLKELGNMVYPLVSSPKDKNTYRPPSVGENNFSPNMNNTLDKMKKKLLKTIHKPKEEGNNVVIIVIVAILVIIVVGLIIYNVTIHKKIQKFKNMNQRITNLYVVQDFINAIGETSTVEQKIKKINDILIERYEIKYSTIVVFDGAEYQVKASNVDKKHWDTLKSLQDVDMFKDSIQTATPKYVTVNNEKERLPYQQMEFGRAKSAIFFPLYIDNVYIGYWIIESGTPHDFDNVDTTVLEVIKENIVSVLKTVVHQKTLETIVRTDQFTGLYSEEYLYGEGKKIIDQYTISTICMFKIINIQEINKKYSRELGNKVITKISNYIKQNISSDYVFVRYMGPKFVIAFSGVEAGSTADFLNEMKNVIESMKIELTPGERQEQGLQPKEQGKEVAIPKLNFVISSYYKGTGLEEVLKKLEEYLDEADINESNITNI